MREQEVKFKYLDAYSVLLQNADVLDSHLIVDTYYDTGSDSMLTNDRVLRVRQFDDQFYIAYKGPRAVHSSKVIDREEIEMRVENGKIHSILYGLGYYKRDVLEKRRTTIIDKAFPDISICLDVYPFIGRYVEAEGDEKRIQSYLEHYNIPHEVLETLNCTELFFKFCTDHDIHFENVRTAQTFKNEEDYYAHQYK